jgi:hypothetical protein
MLRQLRLMTSGNEPAKSGQGKDDETSIINAYGKEDSHIEETSGYSKIEEYPNKQRSCDMCGMVARNDEELQRHVQSTHD